MNSSVFTDFYTIFGGSTQDFSLLPSNNTEMADDGGVQRRI
jgi:hypothetical protein